MWGSHGDRSHYIWYASAGRISDCRTRGMKTWKIVVEKHADGYVAYPLGLRGVVVGEARTICTQAGIGRDEFLAAYERA
jgi:hypothetical protein